MSKNFVQCSLVTPLTSTATELVMHTPVPPYQYPGLTAGTLVIADSVARPSFYEVISYTHRIDNVLYGVVRGKEGTTALNWTGTTWVYQALTAQDYLDALASKAPLDSPVLTGVPQAPTAAPGTNTNQIATMSALQAAIAALIESSPAALNTLNELAAALGDDPNFATTMTTALAGKEPSIAAGTAAQMWLGNKTWSTVLSQVQAVLLTGLGAGSNSTILASDTLIAALAKIQNQLNNKAASSDSRLSDSREWTASEVSQVEAEAGTVTTARKWSALRVAQAVRGGILTGLNVTLTGTVAATDTVLTSLGKLQKQITDAATNLAGTVRATVLTGYTVGTNTAVVATDSVLAAFQKLQGQMNTRAPLASPALTGVPTVPTSAVGTNNTQIASTAYVVAEIGDRAPTKAGVGATGTWPVAISGNAATATKLATASSITLAGDVTGSANFDGSGNISITATVVDDSHNHTVANVAGLQAALDARYTKVEADSALSGKVDKVAGKQLSTEDFSTTEKTKLSGIAAGAQVNVATSIGQGTRTSTGIPLTSSTGSGTTLPVATTALAGLQSAADKAKLDGVATGATTNATDAALRDRATHTGTQAQNTVTNLSTDLAAKQATLVSGTNLKTINGVSLLSGGNIELATAAQVGDIASALDAINGTA